MTRFVHSVAMVVMIVAIAIAILASIVPVVYAQTFPARLPGIPLAMTAIVIGVVQWLVGFAVKRWGAAINQVIPWISLILGFLGWALVPVEASAAGVASHAVKDVGFWILGSLQTILVTGLHEWILNGVVRPLAGRVSKGTTYLDPA